MVCFCLSFVLSALSLILFCCLLNWVCWVVFLKRFCFEIWFAYFCFGLCFVCHAIDSLYFLKPQFIDELFLFPFLLRPCFLVFDV